MTRAFHRVDGRPGRNLRDARAQLVSGPERIPGAMHKQGRDVDVREMSGAQLFRAIGRV